jgi:sarcosine oxidase subunit gamma
MAEILETRSEVEPLSRLLSPQVQVSLLENLALLRLCRWLGAGPQPTSFAGNVLPTRVGDMLDGAMHVLCLGPQEWMLVSATMPGTTLCRQFGPELARQGIGSVDLSAALSVFEVRGTHARSMLSRGCGLDLHPRAFAPGRCARTRFARITATLWCTGSPERFQVCVARSHARYLCLWLARSITVVEGHHHFVDQTVAASFLSEP